MALTRLDRVGDGSTTVYDVTFHLGYMRREFVFVYLTGSEHTQQLSYSWINSTQIELDAPLAAGVNFNIRRVVVRDAPVNDYEAGAILREDNLDDSFLQHLMILEEIEDGYSTVVGDYVIRSDIDMLAHRVKNVGPATEDGDAINRKTLVDTIRAVAVSGGSIISEDAPDIKVNGQRWTRCADMRSFIWYEDIYGGQWVEDNPSIGGIPTTGASGTFISSDSKTITVVHGLITSIS